MDSTLYWLWLAEALGSGCRLASRLLEEYPDPAELYGQVKAGWNPPEYLSAKAREFMQAVAPAQMAGLKKRCDDLNIFILTPDSADYPQRLRDLPDLPLVLYGTGNPACLNGRRYVGMVGTRRPSAYGRQAAFDLSLEMAKQGAVIVSGLADGLDSEGHRAAVEAGTPTVAFLGTAIDTTYPAANVKLRQRIEKGGGAVCSEYPPGYQGKQKGTFLARNRLIAGLSEVLCVAEARIRSGTLNTVSHAESLGRPVLAVPGSIYSAQSQGTNELLRSGRAGVLCQAADVLACMGVESESAAPEQSAFVVEQTSPDAQAVYAVLGPTPKGVDELAAATGLSASRVLAACTELELYGGAQSQPGRRYVAL